MADLSTPPPSRVPVGFVVVNGQRLDVTVTPEWARYIEALNSGVVVVRNAVGLPGALGTTGAAGSGFMLESSDSVEFVPGPPGRQGDPGDRGMALFMLQDDTPQPENAQGQPTQYNEAFIAPTLLNGWANFGGAFNPAGYYKDRAGIVHLRGLISGGTITAGTALLTLPTGYRPANTEIYGVASGGAFGEMRIDAAGNVMIQSGSAAWISLDGITFRALGN